MFSFEDIIVYLSVFSIIVVSAYIGYAKQKNLIATGKGRKNGISRKNSNPDYRECYWNYDNDDDCDCDLDGDGDCDCDFDGDGDCDCGCDDCDCDCDNDD